MSEFTSPKSVKELLMKRTATDEEWSVATEDFFTFLGEVKALKREKTDIEALIRENEKLKLEKVQMEDCIRAARSIPKIRKKIERLQTAFEMTAGITANEMEKVVMAHLKNLKSELYEEITSKLDNMENSTKKRMMEFFNCKTTKELVGSVMNDWKDETIKKINEYDGLDDTVKPKIIKMLTDTRIQYPSLMNSRFIMWVYFFLRCPDPRITEMKTMIEEASLNIYLFCIGVAELYTITSSVFHPASTVYSKISLTNTEVVDSLRNDYEIEEKSILGAAKILLSVDTTNTESTDAGKSS